MPSCEAIRSYHSFEAREGSNLGLDQNGNQLGSKDWETLNAVGSQGRTLERYQDTNRDRTTAPASRLQRTYIIYRQC